MTATIALILRVAMFAALYGFLLLAVRMIWKSVTAANPLPGNRIIPVIELACELKDEQIVKEFSSTEVLIGRDMECDYVIPHATVSNRHGRLSYHQNQWWYEDLKSTNGSFLEELRIEEPIVLKNSDVIYCGEAQIIVKIHINE